MNKTGITSALMLVFLACAQPPATRDATAKELAELKLEMAQLRQEIGAANKNHEGRWRIEMRQGVRADIYLLDTATGRIWREYEDKEKHQMWWMESKREDDVNMAALEAERTKPPIYIDPETGKPIEAKPAPTSKP